MRCWTCTTICLLCFLAIALPLQTLAHPISITRADVYLTRDRATVRIDVFLEDLYLFHQLKPNQQDFLDVSTIERGIQLHQEFLRQRFVITDVEGNRHEPQSVQALAVDLPSEGVPLADLMAHQLAFEFQYAFPTQPEILTFTQRFTDEQAVLPSEMQFKLQQENAGTAYEQTLLPNAPYSLRINWDNPPLSPEASERERAAWSARERESLLGITNYSNVYSFLYVEDFEVRHEILAPVMMFSDELSISADMNLVLDVPQQDAIRQRMADYFQAGNPMVIDDKLVEPVVQRCEFYGLDMKDFASAAKRRPLPVANARVGVILCYRLVDRPTRLAMTWDRFNNNLWGVTTVVLSGDHITRKKLTRVGDRNTLQWQRSSEDLGPSPIEPIQASNSRTLHSIPWVSCLLGLAALLSTIVAIARQQVLSVGLALALLVGAVATWSAPRAAWSSNRELVEAEALSVFRRVHANLYRSFSRRTEESIYDSLALSVDGPLLRKLYLQVRESLAMEDQGGASARIRKNEIVGMQRVPDAGGVVARYRVQCRWNVSGTVEHWGHIHARTNQYDAEFVLAPVSGYWKVIDMQVLTEQRLTTETTLRTM